MNESIHYPLMFTFRDCISGDGFLAGVTISGRALMLSEEGEWWIYGVRPSAIAETGETPQETFLRFRERTRRLLFDFALQSSDFAEFDSMVSNFFYENDEEEEARWKAAFKRIRTGEIEPEGSFLSTLPKEPPEERPAQITVERIEQTMRFAATDNVRDACFIAKAA